MEMNWSADVRNDELFYVTAQDILTFPTCTRSRITLSVSVTMRK